MTVLEYVKDLLETCPAISLEDVQTDTADPEEMLYSITQEPVAPVVTQYFRGEADKQLAFHLLCWKDRYTEDLREQNYQNYEALSQWFNKLNNLHQLPTMESGRMAQRIEVVGNPYEHEKQDDATAACYGMQCVFYYFEKGVI